MTREPTVPLPDPGPELTTVSYDEAVVHVPATPRSPARVRRYTGLPAGATVVLDGVEVRTLPRPGGELLATFATVNDVHFGETACGVVEGDGFEGLPAGPVIAPEPGEPPYPEVMSGAAADEIAEASVDLVIAKGDLTAAGLPAELDAFCACYGRFGGRMVTIPGNHDVAQGPVAFGGAAFPRRPPFAVDLPGVTIAAIDTTRPGWPSGFVPSAQLEWLDELAARADRPVVVVGHHHPWAPGSRTRPSGYFGINPDDSEALVGVVARRRAIVAYLAGHTHRNRVRRFPATGEVPWVEVASVKEFPGVWAEYRVHAGGIAQVVRRLSSPAALSWSERTRRLYGGSYARYSFGQVGDRCFVVSPR